MIEIRTYTKEELAEELGVSCKRDGDIRADKIVDKLRRDKFNFTTSGKGKNYRINITGLPQITLKAFAERYLGITARFEDRLAQFLYRLLDYEGNYATMTASSLEWFCESNDDTIQAWLNALIKCGLLYEKDYEESFYATMREKGKANPRTGNYQYKQLWKEISVEEYQKAIKAYADSYTEYMKNIETDANKIEEEGIYLANNARREALDGWGAKRRTDHYKIIVNREWSHLEELSSLLETVGFDRNFEKEKTGNAFDDWIKMNERIEKWEKMKEEKKKRLDEMKRKEEELEKAEVLPQIEGIDNSDMPIFTNVRDALLYIKDHYVYKGELMYGTREND